MKFVYAVLFLALVAVASASDVIVMTEDSFDNVIESNDFILVEFFAPWCGHCKKLAPEWEKAATELKGVVALASVDATEQQELASRFGIRGYPTIKFFRNGVEEDYNGPREAAGIVNWAKKQVDPVPLVDAADVEELRNNNERVVVGSALSEDALDYFKQFAVSQNEVVVVAVSDGSALGVSAGSAVMYAAHLDGGAATFDEDNFEGFADWANGNAFPLVEEVPESGATFRRLFGSGKAICLVFLDETDERDAQVKELNALAEDLKEDMRFAWLDTGIWARVLPQVGASGSVTPTAACFPKRTDDEESMPQPMPWNEEEAFSIAGLRAFANGVLDGTAKAWTKSEPIPESNDGPVKVLVWKNFEDEVLNSGKKVFVEFYAPWCGHCKSLAPTWESLGEAFADDDSIVIAKMDATANHVPSEYGVQGFPTLKLFIDGKPTDYSGGRDLESLKSFVESN